MPKDVLLVVSDPALQGILSGALGPLNVRTVTSAAAAVVQLRERLPALVVLHLSVHGWREVLDRTREGDTLICPSAILVTPEGVPTQPQWIEAGADDVFSEKADTRLLQARAQCLVEKYEATHTLWQRCRDLEQIRREQRETVELIVHDLKNPIAVAEANVVWSKNRLHPDQDDVVDALADSHEALGRLRIMVEDLLSLARLEQSKLTVKREWVALTELLDEVMQTHRHAASAKNISLSVRREDNLGLVGDPVLLRRVVDNIVSNSLRYTPASGRVELKASSGDGVEIAVSNTGRPIPAEDRAHIFDKFVQGSNAVRRRFSVGLGLYFCKCAIEAHRGEISLVETDEFPTSFVMRIPAA